MWRPQRLNPQALIMLFALVSAQAAATVVTATAGDPVFGLLVHTSLLAAFGLALGNLRWRLPLHPVGYGLLVAAAVAFALRASVHPLVAVLYPNGGLMSDPNEVVAILLVWFMVAFGLLQYRRELLAFVSACGLAIFGLIGVINLEPGFLIAFLVYLFSTILAWSYEAVAARAPVHTAAMWWRVARSQAVNAAFVLVAVGVLATGLSTVLYHTVPSPYAQPGHFRPMWTWAGALMQGNFYVTRELAVGAGPVHLSQQVLFRARAEYPDLWRLTAYDRYDGRSWSQSSAQRYRLERLSRYHLRVPHLETTGQRLNRQEFTVETASTNGVLAAPFPAEIVFSPGAWGGAKTMGSMDGYGSLAVSPVSLPGSTYQVVSVIPENDPQKLRAAGQSYPRGMHSIYVADVPLAAQARLSELTREVTAAAVTPYDKAIAIMRFLEDHASYTERAPVTPAGQDAAAWFVLESRRGACDLFATAMAVMLRLSGVPARVASGFVTGDWDEESQSFLVRAAHAHAWVEVYFPGYGWISFDPSPARALEQQSLWDLLHRGQARYVITQILRRAGTIAMVVALALLLLMFVADPRLLHTRWLQWLSARHPWELVATESRRAAAALLVAAQLTPLRGETPLEMLDRAEAAGILPSAAPLGELRALLGGYYALRFAPQPGSPEQARRLARQFSELRRRIRRRRW